MAKNVRLVAWAGLLATTIGLTGACSGRQPSGQPEGQYEATRSASVETSSPSSPTPSPGTDGHRTRTRAIQVVYARGRSSAELVARRARVPVKGNPLLGALRMAAKPSEPHLRTVVPAGAFSGAGFDGIGRQGAFWVEVSSPRFAHSRLGMSQGEARLAVRAVICTIQSSFGVRQPVDVYPPGGGIVLRELFGTPLPQPHRDRVDVRCPR